MSLLDRLPSWMREDDGADGGANSSAVKGGLPTPRVSTPSFQPPLVATIGGGVQAVSQGHDPELTDKIIAAMTDSVPDLKALFIEADKIKATVPDQNQRITIVMQLKGFTPEKSASVVTALGSALQNVKTQAEGDLAKARTDKVDGPNGRIEANEARKQELQRQINALDEETATLRASVATASQKIANEATRLSGSITQAAAWVESIAGLLGTKH